MTDRVHSLLVVLDKDLRVDDVQAVVDAIKMLRPVLSVTPNVAESYDHFVGQQRAVHELGSKILAVLYPKLDEKKT